MWNKGVKAKRMIQVLRKQRWFTCDLDRAEKSVFQWGLVCSDNTGTKVYGLSLLGVINGVLPYLGMCLVSVDDERLIIKKPWW